MCGKANTRARRRQTCLATSHQSMTDNDNANGRRPHPSPTTTCIRPHPPASVPTPRLPASTPMVLCMLPLSSPGDTACPPARAATRRDDTALKPYCPRVLSEARPETARSCIACLPPASLEGVHPTSFGRQGEEDVFSRLGATLLPVQSVPCLAGESIPAPKAARAGMLSYNTGWPQTDMSTSICPVVAPRQSIRPGAILRLESMTDPHRKSRLLYRVACRGPGALQSELPLRLRRHSTPSGLGGDIPSQ
jgi:hypothetical protein